MDFWFREYGHGIFGGSLHLLLQLRARVLLETSELEFSRRIAWGLVTQCRDYSGRQSGHGTS